MNEEEFTSVLNVIRLYVMEEDPSGSMLPIHGRSTAIGCKHSYHQQAAFRFMNEENGLHCGNRKCGRVGLASKGWF